VNSVSRYTLWQLVEGKATGLLDQEPVARSLDWFCFHGWSANLGCAGTAVNEYK
jgi:hypothetical protein